MYVQDGFLYLIMTRHKLTVFLLPLGLTMWSSCSPVTDCIVLALRCQILIVMAPGCKILSFPGSPVWDSGCYGSQMSDSVLFWLHRVRLCVVLAPQCQTLRCSGSMVSNSALVWLPDSGSGSPVSDSVLLGFNTFISIFIRIRFLQIFFSFYMKYDDIVITCTV